MTAVPSSPDARQELEALLRSRVPLVVIETYDEPRALEMLAALSPRLAAAHTPVFQWTCTDGLRRLDVNLGGSQQHNAEPAAVLKSIRASSVAGIYVLLDFHPFLAVRHDLGLHFMLPEVTMTTGPCLTLELPS